MDDSLRGVVKELVSTTGDRFPTLSWELERCEELERLGLAESELRYGAKFYRLTERGEWQQETLVFLFSVLNGLEPTHA